MEINASTRHSTPSALPPAVAQRPSPSEHPGRGVVPLRATGGQDSQRPLTMRPGGVTWSLSYSDDIAAEARTHAAGQMRTLGVGDDLAHDVCVMVSELATNAYRHGTARSRRGQMGQPIHPELWMYVEPLPHAELVIAVWDQHDEVALKPQLAADDDEHGRGLMVVDALSHRRWGIHSARSRLAVPVAAGKVVWIRVALPTLPEVPASVWEHSESSAARVLANLLEQRGLRHLRRGGDAQVAFVSTSRLIVWCRNGRFSWSGPDGKQKTHPIGNLSTVAEAVVRDHDQTHSPGDSAA